MVVIITVEITIIMLIIFQINMLMFLNANHGRILLNNATRTKLIILSLRILLRILSILRITTTPDPESAGPKWQTRNPKGGDPAARKGKGSAGRTETSLHAKSRNKRNNISSCPKNAPCLQVAPSYAELTFKLTVGTRKRLRFGFFAHPSV